MSNKKIFNVGRGAIDYLVKDKMTKNIPEVKEQIKSRNFKETYSEALNDEFQQVLGIYSRENKDEVVELRRVHDVITFAFYITGRDKIELNDKCLWDEGNFFEKEIKWYPDFKDDNLGRDSLYFASVGSKELESLAPEILVSRFGKDVEKVSKEYFHSHSLFRLSKGSDSNEFFLLYSKGDEGKADDIFDKYFLPFRTFTLKIQKTVNNALDYCFSMHNFVDEVLENSLTIEDHDYSNYTYNIKLFKDVVKNAKKNIKNMEKIEKRVKNKRSKDDYQKFFNFETVKNKNLATNLKIEVESLEEQQEQLRLGLKDAHRVEGTQNKKLSPIIQFISNQEIQNEVKDRLKEWGRSDFKKHLWGHDPNPLFPDHGFRHVQSVQRIAAEIIDMYKEKLELKDIELKFLIYGIWLHDIGMSGGNFIEEDKRVIRKKHALFSSDRITGECNFLGLKEREADVVGNIALYHSSKTALTRSYKKNELCVGSESGEDCKEALTRSVCPEKEEIEGKDIRLKLLSAILRLSDSLDISIERVMDKNLENLLNKVITRLLDKIDMARGDREERLIQLKKEYRETRKHYKVHKKIKRRFVDNKVTYEISDHSAEKDRQWIKDFVQGIIGKDVEASMEVLQEYGMSNFKVEIN